jgi:hypothetical protein
MGDADHMHGNSLAAHATLDVSAREAQVLAALQTMGVASDREIASQMGSADPNAARPRITGLIDRGIVREVGSQVCKVTGRRVRLVEVVA